MATPQSQTLSPGPATRQDKPAPSKARWSKESQRGSDESGESDDGPIVHVTDYGAFSFETDGEIPMFSPIQPPSPEKHQAWESCQERAVSLSKEYPIDFTSVSIVNRTTPQNTNAFPVLVICVSSEKEKQLWKPFLISICQMLHAKDCLELEVALLVPALRSEMQYFSVKQHDPLVRLWPQLREPIQRILGPITWNTLGVLRVGKTEVSAVKTICIGTEDVAEPAWPEIQSLIKLYCQENGAGSLEIEVYLSKREVFANSKETPSRTPLQWLYSNSVQMGQSIGMDEESAGTLGGHVRLVFPGGHSEVLGMSNYHVVRPDYEIVAKLQHEVKRGAWDAAKHFNHLSPYSNVQAPSLKDHLEHFTNLQDGLAKVRKRLDSKSHWKAAIDANEADQSVKARYHAITTTKTLYEKELSEWLTIHEATVAHVEGQIEHPSQSLRGEKNSVDIKAWINARNIDIAYGRVKYTSGFRTTTSGSLDGKLRVLDWSLIEPVSGIRTGSNDLPPQSEMPGDIQFGGETRVRGFAKDSELQEDSTEWYFKTGRTSGLTYGMYNLIDPTVKLELPPNSDHPEANFPIITQEHTIVHRQRLQGKAFSLGGDSGSWVLNAQGMLAGLLFGSRGTLDLYSYFTSVETLLADIKRQTGCLRVELI